MKTKKLLGVAALTAVATFGLVACGGEEKPEPTPTPSKGGTIEFYTSMGDEPKKLLDPVVADFNKTHDWKIKVVNPGGGYDGVKDAVNASIQGGKQPAIAYCYPDHVAEYLTTGKVLNMMDFIKGDNGFTQEQIDDFIPGFWKEGYEAFGKKESDNVMYTLPFSKSTEVMYYNPVALKKLYPNVENIETKVPKTWDEMWKIAEDLDKTTDPDLKGWYTFGYDSEANWMITYDEQASIPYTSSDESEHYLFNNTKNKEFLELLQGKFEKGYFTTKELYGSYTSDLFTKPNDKGKSTIFSIGSSAGANHQKSQLFDAGVAMIPQVDSSKPRSISQGPNLVMFKQSSREAEATAWEFVKTILTPEFQAAFARAQGYMPVIKSAKNVGDFASWLAKPDEDLIAATMKMAIDQMDNYFVSPAFNGSNKARAEIGNALIAALTGVTAEQALQDAYDEASF